MTIRVLTHDPPDVLPLTRPLQILAVSLLPGECVCNLSIFDVADNAELHDLLWNLPLFPYMTIAVTPLVEHPSDIDPAGACEQVTGAGG